MWIQNLELFVFLDGYKENPNLKHDEEGEEVFEICFVDREGMSSLSIYFARRGMRMSGEDEANALTAADAFMEIFDEESSVADGDLGSDEDAGSGEEPGSDAEDGQDGNTYYYNAGNGAEVERGGDTYYCTTITGPVGS